MYPICLHHLILKITKNIYEGALLFISVHTEQLSSLGVNLFQFLQPFIAKFSLIHHFFPSAMSKHNFRFKKKVYLPFYRFGWGGGRASKLFTRPENTELNTVKPRYTVPRYTVDLDIPCIIHFPRFLKANIFVQQFFKI